MGPNPNPTLKGEKVLVLMPWTPKASYVARLKKSHPDLEVVSHAVTSFNTEGVPDDVPNDIWKGVTTLITYKQFPTKELAPDLKYVQLMSAGANHIMDHPLYTDSDVAFCTANGTHPPQMAEWVVMTFLMHQHHLLFYLDKQKEGDWIVSENDEDVEDAVGLRMGILGYGCIGRQCARLAKNMGMDVYAYTLRERATPEARRDESYTEPGMGDPEGIFPSAWFHGTTQADVDHFLSQDLDVLVIAMPLTKLTRNMIAAPQFKLMAKKKTYLVNVGRGPIVNTDDLMTALDEGLIRGAALDVTDPEPLPKGHPLWTKKDVIITPHTSGNSNHYNDRVLGILEYNLKRISEGKDVVNRVNKELGY